MNRRDFLKFLRNGAGAAVVAATVGVPKIEAPTVEVDEPEPKKPEEAKYTFGGWFKESDPDRWEFTVIEANHYPDEFRGTALVAMEFVIEGQMKEEEIERLYQVSRPFFRYS